MKRQPAGHRIIRFFAGILAITLFTTTAVAWADTEGPAESQKPAAVSEEEISSDTTNNPKKPEAGSITSGASADHSEKQNAQKNVLSGQDTDKKELSVPAQDETGEESSVPKQSENGSAASDPAQNENGDVLSDPAKDENGETSSNPAENNNGPGPSVPAQQEEPSDQIQNAAENEQKPAPKMKSADEEKTGDEADTLDVDAEEDAVDEENEPEEEHSLQTFSLDNYIKEFSLSVNGSTYTLADFPVDLGETDRNGEIAFSFVFDMLGSIKAAGADAAARPGDIFVCSVPAVIDNGGSSWTGPLHDPTTKYERQNGSVGTWEVSGGKLILRFADGYIEETHGEIKESAVALNGSFNSYSIPTAGGRTSLLFGNLEVICTFPAIDEVRILNIDKQVSKNDYGILTFGSNDTITYTIRVSAGDSNTETLENVRVTDLFLTDNILADSIRLVKVEYGDKKTDITAQAVPLEGVSASNVYGEAGSAAAGWNIGNLPRGEYAVLTVTAQLDKTKVDKAVDEAKKEKPDTDASAARAVTNKSFAVADRMVDQDGNDAYVEDSDTGYAKNRISVSKSSTYYDPATQKQYYTLTVRADGANKYTMRDVPIEDYFSDYKAFIDSVDVEEGIPGKTPAANAVSKGSGLSNFKNKEIDAAYDAHRWTASVDELKPGESKVIYASAKIADRAWTEGMYYSGGQRAVQPRNYVYFGRACDGHYANDVDTVYSSTSVVFSKTWLSKSVGQNSGGTLSWTITVNAHTSQSEHANEISGIVTDRLQQVNGKDILQYTGDAVVTYYRRVNGTDTKVNVPDALSRFTPDPEKSSFSYVIPEEYKDCKVVITYKTRISDYDTYVGKQRTFRNSAGINGFAVSASTTTPRVVGMSKSCTDSETPDTAEWTSRLYTTVKAGDTYRDYVNNTANHYYTQAQLDAISIRSFDKESGAYAVVPSGSYTVTPKEGDAADKISEFTIHFNDTIYGTSQNPILVVYRSSLIPCALNTYKQYYNTGVLSIITNDGETISDTDYDYFWRSGYQEISKHTYKIEGDKVYWHVMVNTGGFAGVPNGTVSGNTQKRDIAIYEQIPKGLAFLRAELPYKNRASSSYSSNPDCGKYDGGYRAYTNSPSASVTYDTTDVGKSGETVQIMVHNANHWFDTKANPYSSASSRNRQSWLDVTIVTKIIDPVVLQDTSGKTFTWVNNAGLTPERAGEDDLYWASSNASLSHKAMSKEMLYNSGNAPNAAFTIDFNPDDMDLDPDNPMIDVYDTSSSTLQISPDSIRVIDAANGQALKKGTDYIVNMSHMSEDNTFLVSVPDDRHLTIRYTAEVLGAVGETVTVSNRAYFKGQSSSDPAGIEEEVVVMRGSGQSVSDIMVWLDKRDDAGERLAGAAFFLEEYKDGVWKEKSTITIDEPDDTKISHLEEKILYRLTEIKAPDGYVLDNTPYYFVIRDSAEEEFDKPEELDEAQIRSMQVAGTITRYNAHSHEVAFCKYGEEKPGTDPEGSGEGLDTGETGEETDAGDSKDKCLPGASFQVTDTEGNVVWDAHREKQLTWTSGEKPVSFTMAAGEYILTETAPPAGYIRMDDLPFTVETDGTIKICEETAAAVEADNRLTRVEVVKLDDADDRPLPGVSLQILEGEDIVHEWITGEEPEVIIGELSVGKEYVLHEAAAPAGYTPGPDVAFSLSDKGEVLTEALDENGTIRIYNSYAATGGITLSAEKILKGRGIKAGEFRFSLSELTGGDEEILQTKEADEKGQILFDRITYRKDTEVDETGEHVYTIREEKGTLPHVQYDESVYTVTVTAEDQGDGTIAVHSSIAVDGVSADKIQFQNTYEASGSLDLKAEKILKGRELKAGEFQFVLSEKTGGNEKVLQTKEADGSGNISFDRITYRKDAEVDETGEHVYTIREEKGTLPRVQYDESVYTVTVTAEDQGDGTITAKQAVVKDGQSADKIRFENTYTEPSVTPEPTVTPTPAGTPEPTVTPKPTATPKPAVTPKPITPVSPADSVRTGDSSRLLVWVLLLAASGVICLGLIRRYRKVKENR